ncbi:Serine/threonine protein kinase PrkC, regulator of stationary phase [Catellicoccus marimammalium M35/04/3]|uniref:non-specific serine/threonine protein kinase n=4 Tax=Catellicoccus TaxID=300418 RepID=K8ZA23_9ENTE|nr:Stk1 family PASTA domain-containing Ser/Thr kinase [Catellicoccus marimammalium]EKU27904.1 Serine/threonine protein kinase PrkC, regulator of stationary phase [Catellicoccus marimammalium M35/04/3]
MEVGQKINGRYEIIRGIGSGGMAKVYLAYDLILNREVAVKILRFDFQNDPKALQRFQREALAASEIVHPNVVEIYDIGEDHGLQYIVMEYVKGTDLKTYIYENAPISFDKAVDIMQQILSAVAVAHQHRIIHRDLKPQNILINGAGECKITDFGIAVALSETSITQTSTLLGSVHYLSPEQARGANAIPQSDIYALGIILYELLTGKVPFDGESAVSIALKHFQEEIPSVRKVNPNIPQALENVIFKATAKDPNERYRSVNEMSEDLSTVLSATRVNEPVFLTKKEQAELAQKKQAEKEKEQQKEVEPPKQETKKKKKKKKKRKWWLWVLLLLLLLGVGSFFLQPKTSVPDLTGKSVNEAEQILQKQHLKIDDVEYEFDSSIPKNHVIRTKPKEGTTVKRYKKVLLIVSRGTESYTMKNVLGQNIDDVVASLENDGWNKKDIEITKCLNSTFDKNMIFEQEPSAQTKLTVGKDKISLLVSVGSSGLPLEDMSGWSQSEVEQYLSRNGLHVIWKYEPSNKEKGTVLRQEPSSNTDMSIGDSVVVTLASDKETSSGNSYEGTPASENRPQSEAPVNPTTPSSTPASEAPAVSEEHTPESTQQSAPTEAPAVEPNNGASEAPAVENTNH